MLEDHDAWALQSVGCLAALMARLPSAQSATPLAVANDALQLVRFVKQLEQAIRRGEACKRARLGVQKIAKRYGLRMVFKNAEAPFAIGIQTPADSGYKSQGGRVLPLV